MTFYGLQRYQTTLANTSSREDILIMLYEGAIRFLEQSILAHQDGRLSDHKNLLAKGRAIIEEFQNTLDFEQGGNLSSQLFELYDYMLFELTQANLTRDIQHVRVVSDLLKTLLEGWRDAVKQYKTTDAPKTTSLTGTSV